MSGGGDAATRVLVVDDEQDIRRLVRLTLERDGYEVVEATDGKEALRQLFATEPRLVILDVMMPEMSGWTALERIRDVSDIPVILLTARAFETERVRGLRAGADDYVVKPFSPAELAARVGAILRRSDRNGPADVSTRYEDEFLSLEKAERKVVVDGRHVALTPLEYRLLVTLIDHRGEVLDRERLLTLVWGGPGAVFPEQVKLYVGYLRRKLGNRRDGSSPIETVRGFGYIYRPSSA